MHHQFFKRSAALICTLFIASSAHTQQESFGGYIYSLRDHMVTLGHSIAQKAQQACHALPGSPNITSVAAATSALSACGLGTVGYYQWAARKKATETHNAQVQSQNDALRIARAQLIAEQNHLQEQLEHLRNAQQECASLGTERNGLRNDIRDLQQALDNMARDHAQAQNRLQEQSEHLWRLQQELNSVQAQRVQLERQLVAVQRNHGQELTNLGNERSNLKQEVALLQANLQRAIQERDTQRNSAAEHAQGARDAQIQLTSAQQAWKTERRDIQQRAAQTERHMHRACEERNVANQQAHLLAQQIEEADDRTALMNHECAVRAEILAMSKQDLGELHHNITAELEYKLRDTQHKLNSLEKQYEISQQNLSTSACKQKERLARIDKLTKAQRDLQATVNEQESRIQWFRGKVRKQEENRGVRHDQTKILSSHTPNQPQQGKGKRQRNRR